MSDSWFLRRLGPGLCNGMALGQWLRLLARHRGSIGGPYLGRAAAISFASTLNTLAGVLETARFGRAIAGAPVQPPLFVLGVWRSGTTHLHNLLCQDDRFAFPNAFQALNPHIFLTTEWWFAPLQQRLFPATRPFDNMTMRVDEPSEDEFAILSLSGVSPLLSWVFPRSHREYETTITLAQVSEQDRRRWKRALQWFVQKLSFRYQKPLVLKSPNHTARIALLLELFPDARFVCIHRHPFEVYASNVHLVRKILPIVAVQRYDEQQMCDRTIPWYRTLTEHYFDQRDLIADGRLVEIAFDDLQRWPLETLRHIYETLDLPPFLATERKVAAYVASLHGYRRNTYPDLPPATKEILERQWKRSFDEWGYRAESGDQ